MRESAEKNTCAQLPFIFFYLVNLLCTILKPNFASTWNARKRGKTYACPATIYFLLLSKFALYYSKDNFRVNLVCEKARKTFACPANIYFLMLSKLATYMGNPQVLIKLFLDSVLSNTVLLHISHVLREIL